MDTPSDHVELVRRAIAAINARDIEGYLTCCTEDVSLETPMGAVGGTYRGADDIRRFFIDIADAAPDFRIDPESIDEVDPARVLVSMSTSSTGRVSRIPLETHSTNVYDIRDGRINRIRIFLDRAAAIEALGLPDEPAGSASQNA